MSSAIRRLALLALVAIPACSWGLDNGLARTPPMGWNSWNTFFGSISEQLILQVAHAMVSSGMRDAGYRHVNLDDNWMAATRDGQGNQIADPTRFPHGMKWLADSVHSLGLKLGLYSSNGSVTCMGLPAGWGHETQDAASYASWGIDYLKYDNCGDKAGSTSQQGYVRMRDALAASGRPIVFSLCQWGGDNVWLWGDTVGNLWRTTADIGPDWNAFMGCADQNEPHWPYAKPGAWNDPDMLEVGAWDSNTVSGDEYRVHFALWCVMASPLLAGNDIRNMSTTIRGILTNTELIAVNQDSLGIQGRRVRDEGELEWWVKPMADGSKAAVLVNRSTSAQSMALSWSDIGLSSGQVARVRDLWAHADRGEFTQGCTVSVAPHACASLRVSPGADAIAPAIETAYGGATRTQCNVVFTEEVEAASSQAAANYTMSSGVSVSAARLLSDNRTVELTTTAMLPGSSYTVTVSNVRDRSPGHNTIAPNSQASFTVRQVLRLTGTLIGAGDPFGGNAANGYAAAVDGSAVSYADCTGPLLYVGYDFGLTDRYVVTGIRYMPRPGWSSRMVGMRVQVSADNITWTTVLTIGADPATGVYTTDAIVDALPCRYVRLEGTAGYLNVSEIEFSGFLATSTALVAPRAGTSMPRAPVARLILSASGFSAAAQHAQACYDLRGARIADRRARSAGILIFEGSTP